MNWLKLGEIVCQQYILHCIVHCILLFWLFNLYAEYIMWILGWMSHKLESILLGEITTTSDMQIIPPCGRKQRRTKEPLMKVKQQSEKAGLEFSTQKTKAVASGSFTLWQIDGERVETVTNFIFLGSKIIEDSDCSHEIKRHLLLGRKTMPNLA